MKDATLCFLLDENKILLGMKKVRFGAGKYNGFGGKRDEGETVEEAAIRELKEEAGVEAKEIDKMATLHFKFPVKTDWNQTVHVFFVNKWEGKPVETEEMRPEWFDTKELPYDKMWADDKHWMPLVLEGKKIEAHFNFDEDNESIKEHKIEHL